MAQLRLVLFTHSHCGLCIPVKDMIIAAKVLSLSSIGIDVTQSAPAFRLNPFLDHYVDIHAKGNEFWNRRYGLKIPVLYLYRLQTSIQNGSLNELEREFFNDPVWLEGWQSNGTSWRREERIAIDLQRKVMAFEKPNDMVRWIWKL